MQNSVSSSGDKAAARARAGWKLRRLVGLALLLVVLAAGAAWSVTALWYQAPPAWRGVWMGLAVLVATGLAVLGFRRQALAWLGTALAALVMGLWWASILPSNTRDWAPELDRTVTAQLNGSEITLHNVRNFDWRTEEDFTPRWETRTYDLRKLRSVDLFSSVWASPSIAHTLIGFGFEDGEHVVFSIEIRREKSEAFSEIGGFFKEFELSMIAADENDIIRLRTDARGETVSIYPLKVTPRQARELFLFYLARSNALAEKPEFYQTIATNCTTVIYDLARLVDARLPFDWRILLSGHLPDYLYDLGLIRTDAPLAEVRRDAVIPPQNGRSEPFSKAIRGRVAHPPAGILPAP
ncbi:Lnb N-terminal periplasmic domain-containing protein [Xanthobacter sp. TB0139]|uniref:Lnb N-terminal periplasmic domain-containing protein n=1 Tax=Xanthobacter sp. TB0139 TaxID=3459178 RepID=UPI004039BC77